MSSALRSLLVAGLVLAGAAGCGSSPPTQPTSLVLEVSAPESVATGASAEVTLTGRRENGSPAAGVAVSVSTDVGTVSPATVTLDGQGMGAFTFTAPDEPGSAQVVVDAGGIIVQVTIAIVGA